MEDWFVTMPVVTRAYLVGCTAMTLFTMIHVLKPVSLFLSFSAVLPPHWQVWRLLTNFVFFDSTFSLSWFFHMYFFVRHSAALERESFADRTADFAWLWATCSVFLAAINAALFYIPVTAHLAQPFLGPSLTFAVVYIWSRRNPDVMMSFFGLFVFAAPYLPWVLILFGAMLGHNPIHDVLGLIAGHVYYYFEDVLPQVFPHAPQILRTPSFLKRLLDPPTAVPVVPPVGEDHDHHHQE